jgi:hypothetical protein
LPELVKAVLERGLRAELTNHVGYGKGDPAGRGSPNSRNGSTPKTLATAPRGGVPPGQQRALAAGHRELGDQSSRVAVRAVDHPSDVHGRATFGYPPSALAPSRRPASLGLVTNGFSKADLKVRL